MVLWKKGKFWYKLDKYFSVCLIDVLNIDNLFWEKKSIFQPQPHCAGDITDDDNEEVEVVSLFSLS